MLSVLFKKKINFKRDAMEGQMTVQERKKIYRLVRQIRPHNVFEIGTWKGGGSTYILSTALYHNGSGELYTVEANSEFHAHAIDLYNNDLKHLKNYIRFYLGDSLKVYPPVIEEIPRVDILLLDGAEDAEQTLREWKLFAPKILTGSVVFCHDWKTEKTKLVRSIFIDSKNWECISLLEQGPTGFAAFRKL